MNKYLKITAITLFTAVIVSLTSCRSGGDGVENTFIDSIEEAPNPTAILFFVGDAMQHLPQINRARVAGNGEYDYSECFRWIFPAIKRADYAVVNLEVPLGGANYSGYPLFCAPDAFAVSLKEAGFDLFLTANNHTLDRLDKGLRRTVAVLDSIGVDHIGTYQNLPDRDAKVPFVKDINGFKIGFLNYTYGTNGLSATDGAVVSYIDTCQISKEIASTLAAGAELTVACMHWGEEYERYPNRSQKILSDFLLSKGVDVIIGAHPHVIEPMELISNKETNKNALIVYSLGNFISNQTDIDTRGGVGVYCTVERDEDGSAILTDASYEVFFTAKPDANVTNFMVVPASMDSLIPPAQQTEWMTFKNRAVELLSKENKEVRMYKEN